MDIDEIKSFLITNNNTKDQSLAYIYLGYKAFGREPDQAVERIDKGISLAKENDFEEVYARGLHAKGIVLKNQGKSMESLEWLLKGLEIREELKIEKGIAASKLSIGNVYFDLGQFDKASVYYYSALKIYESLQNFNSILKVKTGLGGICFAKGEYDAALTYNLENWDFYKNQDPSRQKIISAKNIAGVYKEMGEYKKALRYNEIALQMSDSLRLEDLIESIQLNKGTMLMEIEKDEEAEKLFQGILDNYIGDSLNEKTFLVLENLGVIYMRESKYEKAESYFRKAQKVALKSEKLNDARKLYKNMVELYEISENHLKASQYKTLLAEATNSIFNIEKENLIKEKEVTYKVDKWKGEIVDIKQKSTRITFAAAVLGLILLLAMALLWTYYQRQKAQKEVILQKEQLMKQSRQINAQVMVDLLKKQEIESMKALLEGQEKERNRIAKELHDRICSSLSSAKIILDVVGKQLKELPEPAQEKFDFVKKIISDTTKEARTLSHQMYGHTLKNKGLKGALVEMEKTIETTGEFSVEMTLAALEDVPMTQSAGADIYGIIQELFQNIIKHSDAIHVNLKFEHIDNTLMLKVEDDGKGFDTNDKKVMSGFGMNSIAARVKKLNGNSEWISNIGKGTLFILHIPIEILSQH